MLLQGCKAKILPEFPARQVTLEISDLPDPQLYEPISLNTHTHTSVYLHAYIKYIYKHVYTCMYTHTVDSLNSCFPLGV